jgi:CRISPR-associated DxTHG motif protein
MGRIYISNLGLGQKNSNTGAYEYHETAYELENRLSSKTRFVQVAELEILGPESFDKVLIVATKKAIETHFETLCDSMAHVGAPKPTPIAIDEDMSPNGQWRWFEKLLDPIEDGDRLTIDLTHGYRSIPIIFTAAIHFLRKARSIELEAVYYGAFDRNRGCVPIVDMKDFFYINEWAEAVSRLAEDADARKLARIAKNAPPFQIKELGDKRVIDGFDDLTDALRNVEVNHIAEKAVSIVTLLQEIRKSSSIAGGLLVDQAIGKFSSLARQGQMSGKYDRAYFGCQIEIIRMLLDHKHYMQAFTAMREMIGSMGMIAVAKKRYDTADGRKERTRYADIFINFFCYPENKWNHGGKEKERDRLKPFYDQLKQVGIEKKIRSFSNELVGYRNGFDHAWTAKSGAFLAIEENGRLFLKKLEEVISLIMQHQLLL